MFKKEDLVWHIHKTNNIETNPIDEIFCIFYDEKNDFAKKFAIRFQYPRDEKYLTHPTENFEDAEYFILFLSHGKKDDLENKLGFGGFSFGHDTLLYVSDDIELQKKSVAEFYMPANLYPLGHIASSQEEFNEWVNDWKIFKS